MSVNSEIRIFVSLPNDDWLIVPHTNIKPNLMEGFSIRLGTRKGPNTHTNLSCPSGRGLKQPRNEPAGHPLCVLVPLLPEHFPQLCIFGLCPPRTGNESPYPPRTPHDDHKYSRWVHEATFCQPASTSYVRQRYTSDQQ
jgi:hypothetical protein